MNAVEAIGVLSGTSMDAIDVVWVGFEGDGLELRSSYEHPMPKSLRSELQALLMGCPTLAQVAVLDRQIGDAFGDAILAFFAKEGIGKEDIDVIGSHGQTVWHAPDGPWPATLQLGDPNTIVVKTGCPVVCDFRRRDVVEGGQGAPLAPLFHQTFLHQDTDAVVNIGGIANLSLLNAGVGFDTGPGNALLDAWMQQCNGQTIDMDGRFAKSGQVIPALLEALLADPYFMRPYPKSTGLEYFNLAWLSTFDIKGFAAHDIQATLVELTARSIAQACQLDVVSTLLVCGGGACNPVLMQALDRACHGVHVMASDAKGWPSAALEGMLFAWLAKCRLCMQPVDLAQITGGGSAMLLGGLYAP